MTCNSALAESLTRPPEPRHVAPYVQTRDAAPEMDIDGCIQFAEMALANWTILCMCGYQYGFDEERSTPGLAMDYWKGILEFWKEEKRKRDAAK